MNNLNFITESGLLSGFHYHDQFLESININNYNTKIKILTGETKSYELILNDSFIVSIDSFVPGTIISSCFVWKIDNLPSWFKTKKANRYNLGGYPDESKYVFYLTSSYGADIYVTFNKFELLDSSFGEIIWEFP